MVSPAFSYFACQSRNCGITFLQLYQPKVQNSTMTTRPRSFSRLSGSLLIHGPPVISGARAPSRNPMASTAPGPTAPARSAAASTHTPATFMNRLLLGGSNPCPVPILQGECLPGWTSPGPSAVRGGPGEEVGYPRPTPYNNDCERMGMGPSRFTDAVENYPNRKGNG